jgi:NAD(P)-dependent dehydrogenase (short-subunit alcohol dehydrogenase family)
VFRLDGKIAAVTGAGSGIGRAIATLFGRQGAQVAVLDLDAGSADAVAAEIERAGGRSRAWRCDVSSREEVSRTFSEVGSRLGGLDILVNNAGVAAIGKLESTEEADMDRVYAVNVKGVYHCARAALPLLLERSGANIVNIASLASLVGVADRFAYSMSKGAVLTMTLSIAIDYMKRIRCNCICPARIHTPFVDGYLEQHYPGREQEMLEQLSEYQPVGRMGRPEEVAALALYLASDEAAFVTGQAYPIDGGVMVA